MEANPQSGSSSTILDRIYSYYCKGNFRQVHYLATVDAGKRRAATWTKAQSKSYPTRKHIRKQGSHECAIIHEMTSFHG